MYICTQYVLYTVNLLYCTVHICNITVIHVFMYMHVHACTCVHAVVVMLSIVVVIMCNSTARDCPASLVDSFGFS